jgi:VacB/RNase II family 3'-5' exoribonuclease
LDENNKPIDLIFKVIKDSNKLIEEFMLLANKRVAYLLNSNEYPVVNRVHEEPSPEKLASLKEFIKQFGYVIKTNTPQEITKTLNKLLEDVKDKPEENMINNLVVRSMQKAQYSMKNLGHYGLGFEDYSHFTSPIRRYPDVMTHRLLLRYLEGKPQPKMDKLEARCQYLSERERKAQKAENMSIKHMQSIYMSDKIGRVYEGIVSSITDYGVFVNITINNCDCLVKFDKMNGICTADIKNYCVKNSNGIQILRLGDIVNIVISSVNVEKKTIDAVLFNA